jgi:hypothetical protein
MWKRPFALWIGLLASHKSPLEVIEIARMVPQMDFVMVGWPFDRSIANWLQAEKPANLYYLGAVPDDLKNELIEKCCVGLTTSKYEGFGLVPFEFLSAGKPVLAYPLEVFKEVYGNLIVYADSIDDFVKHLRQICSKGSCMTVDIDAVTKRQARFDLARAVSRIVRRLDTKSLLVFTQDVSIGQDAIAGYYLFQWRLWKFIKENGIDLHIFTSGEKFSKKFDLADHTTQVGRIVEYLHLQMEAIKGSHNFMGNVGRRITDLLLRIVEPLCYVYQYITRRKNVPSRVIIATGYSQIIGGIIVKYFFGLKLACIIHDARLEKDERTRSSLFMKIYYLAYFHALRHVDVIMTASNTARKELLNYYPCEDRLMVIW